MNHLIKPFVLLIILFSSIRADAFVADNVRCLKDLQTNFFNPAYVNQALSTYIIPEGLWPLINSDLRRESQTVPDRMKKLSLHMVPNPLEYPLNKFEAAKLLKLALYQAYVDVMRRHYITEHPTLEDIFDYIFAKESARLIACFGDEVRELIPELI